MSIALSKRTGSSSGNGRLRASQLSHSPPIHNLNLPQLSHLPSSSSSSNPQSPSRHSPGQQPKLRIRISSPSSPSTSAQMGEWNGKRMREGSTSSAGGGMVGSVGVETSTGCAVEGSLESDDALTEDDLIDDIKNAREEKRRKRNHQAASGSGIIGMVSASPSRTPTNSSFRDRDLKGKGKECSSSPSTKDPRFAPYPTDAALTKRKNQRLASQEKKEARREKMMINGLGGEGESLGGVEFGHDEGPESEIGESESLRGVPEDSRSDDEKMEVDEETKRRSTPERHRHQMAKDKHASKKMGEGRRKGSFKGKGRGHGSPTTRKSGRSPFQGGRVGGDGMDASDGDVSSNDTDDADDEDAVNEEDDEPNGFGGKVATLDDELPLPDGIDPKDVEDPLLDAVPTMSVRQSGNWVEESSDEEFLFESLSDYSVNHFINEEHSDSPESSSGSDTSATDEDDPMLDVFGTAIGLEESSDLPLVLMEDWSGNLIFAQPRMSEEGPTERRRRNGSKSRSRSSLSARGSRTGSTSNGDAPILLIDPEAIEQDWDDEYDMEDVDGGDTTDSLPSDEDMPSPPEIGPFSLAAKGIEANNAAFGVTTIDEAALAQDLGVPLEDARNLLERVRNEEALQAQGINDAASFAGEQVTTPGDSVISDGILNHTAVCSPSASTSNGTTVSPVPASAVPFTSPAVVSGVPVMGSFLPECADPGKRAVIDGTGKNTPSPFARKGALRGRTRGGKVGGSAIKKQTLGNAATSPLRRPRFSSVPAASRGRFRSGNNGSPLRGQGFDREDTPSDADLPAEPISIDDVLDTNALHHHTYETDHHGDLDGSRHMRSLRRWEKVPITTFRRSRISSIDQDGHFMPSGSAHGYPASGTALRNAMANPGSTLAADNHRNQLIFSQGMIISPVLQPLDETVAVYGGDANHMSRKSRRKEDRRARNGETKRLRTSSLGVMPPLDLGGH